MLRRFLAHENLSAIVCGGGTRPNLPHKPFDLNPLHPHPRSTYNLIFLKNEQLIKKKMHVDLEKG